jgi:folate/biopterin transporter
MSVDTFANVAVDVEAATDRINQDTLETKVSNARSLGSASTDFSSSLSSSSTEPEKDNKSTTRWCMSSPPCALYQFLKMLHGSFGGYVPMVIMQYGVNQGFGVSVAGMARRYFFADILHLDGATIGRYTTAAMIPWSIKPVIGMLSDSFPAFGFHRTSYIAGAGLCGLLAYACLGLMPLAAVASVLFFFLVNLSVAVPDVMIDGTTAELSKKAPEHASDLQSLSWGALSIGGICACSTSGLLIEYVGPQKLFLILCCCSLAIVIPAMLRWLPEQRVAKEDRRLNTSLLFENKWVVLLAALMTLVSVSLSAMNVLVDNPHARGIFTLVAGFAIAIGVYMSLRNISPLLAKTALFIFLRECMQPGLGDAMFIWLKDYPEGPQFSARVMGWMDCFGYVGLLLGVTLYNKYLTHVSYQKIFLIAQVAMVLANMFDLVLVKRWNLLLDIPDIVFIAGDDTFTTIMGRFFSMPMLVLASKVCPDGLEATLFALLMALSNFGAAISQFFGVTLCEVFGIVGDSFDRLPDAVIAKSLFRLVPIPLIFLLVPNLRPCDPVPADFVVSKVGGSTVIDETKPPQNSESEEVAL